MLTNSCNDPAESMSTTTPRRRPPGSPEPSPSVRQRLLEAALQVLGDDGIHALTQTRVAERAGLRQSHLTYYFPTRNDLLKGVVEHAAGETPFRFMGQQRVQKPTLAALKTHLGAQVTDVRLARLMLAMTAASDEDPSLKQWMTEFDRRMREMFGEVLASLGYRVRAQEVALFHATMVGIAVLNSSEGTAESAAQARRMVVLALERLVASASPP
jgi:DNA-binding transcriptional regulator YbjK